MKNIYFTAIFFLASASLSQAVTYNLSATLTSYYSNAEIMPGIYVSFERVTPATEPVISGTLTTESSNAAINLLVAERTYTNALVSESFIVHPLNLSYNTTVAYDSDFNYGGYGSYYYEEEYYQESISAIPEHLVAHGSTPEMAASSQAATRVSLSQINLDGYYRYTEYTYGDDDQGGTPGISESEYFYSPAPFTLTLEFIDAVNGTQLFIETYEVTLQEVPLPGAVWMFASAVAGLFARGHIRRSGV